LGSVGQGVAILPGRKQRLSRATVRDTALFDMCRSPSSGLQRPANPPAIHAAEIAAEDRLVDLAGPAGAARQQPLWNSCVAPSRPTSRPRGTAIVRVPICCGNRPLDDPVAIAPAPDRCARCRLETNVAASSSRSATSKASLICLRNAASISWPTLTSSKQSAAPVDWSSERLPEPAATDRLAIIHRRRGR
jgi:hypothetical protein